MSTQIIIVDDDPLIAEMLATAAGMIGFQTLTFMHGVEFLSHDVQPHDIVVLDLNMPGFDGIEVLRALSEKKISVSLVLISGQDRGVLHSAEKLARAHSMDVIGSLTKPITIPEFQHLLLRQYAKFRDQKSPLGVKETLLPEADEVEYAIRDGQLVVHYQPQVDMNTSLMVGVEALVRWQHPERGMIYPDMFIPVAEKNGLMGELTASVFSSVLKDSQGWREQGLTLHQSINISADNISSLGLPEQLMSLLDDHQRAPSSLTLEITESTLMDELVTSLDILTRLRMKGFELSIDDFGTGYSSLSHLHRIPFTELKIDRGFVSDMIVDTEARAITRTCIMLGHELNMKVVAEGIESQAIWDMLVEYGCDYAQGYYIAKPMSAEALFEWSVSNKHKN